MACAKSERLVPDAGFFLPTTVHIYSPMFWQTSTFAVLSEPSVIQGSCATLLRSRPKFLVPGSMMILEFKFIVHRCTWSAELMWGLPIRLSLNLVTVCLNWQASGADSTTRARR
eukprot:2432025-Amphidinium_carterae.2